VYKGKRFEPPQTVTNTLAKTLYPIPDRSRYGQGNVRNRVGETKVYCRVSMKHKVEKGETPEVSTPLVLHPHSTLLHWYSPSTPLEKKYQWSTTGVEWSIGKVGSE
jgi:hypothetical protein